MPEKKYRCPECGKMTSDEEGCVCDRCAEILIQIVLTYLARRNQREVCHDRVLV